MKSSLNRQYFDDLYARDPDPWHFATKIYEHEKYAATLENLPRPRYGYALELGCSIGVLTEQLAKRADHLLAIDAAHLALDSSIQRCKDLENIDFERATLPGEFPAGKFDLVMMSEVGYYFATPDLQILSEKILESLKLDADLVLVHYLPTVPDYPLTGDEVHEFFRALPGLKRLHSFRASRYRFDSFRRIVK